MSEPNQIHAVLGANGVIGQGVIGELAARGVESRPVGRSPHPGWCKADLTDAADTARAMEGASHAYLCAGFAYDTAVWKRDWPKIMDNVIRGAQRHGTRVVFLDNIYMYGPPPLRKPIEEDHPQEPSSQKGKVRKEIAATLLEAHREGKIQALIARAPDFYGPGATNSMLYQTMIAKILKGQRAMWIGDPDRLHSFGHTTDIAKSMVLLALDSGAYGQVWHTPTSCEGVTARELHRMIAKQLGKPAKLMKMGQLPLSLVAMFVPIVRELKEMSYQYFTSYSFSSAKFERRFPSFKITPYETGIAQMVESFNK